MHGSFPAVYSRVGQKFGVDEHIILEYHRTNLADLLTGRITMGDMQAAFGLAEQMSTDEFLAVWTEAMTHVMRIDPAMLSLLNNLRGKYQLGALTNLTEHRYQFDLDQGLYEYFDFAVLSSQVGVRKPEPAFYELGLAHVDAKPSEVVFIDDLAQNTEAAAALGMQTILFTNYEDLTHELKKLGVTAPV